MKQECFIKSAILLIFFTALFFQACNEEPPVEEKFTTVGSWWTAKSAGGNTIMFIEFTSESEFNFYDLPVRAWRTSFYSSVGTYTESPNGEFTFNFRTADIDLNGVWKDQDLSSAGLFDDLIFTTGYWHPQKPAIKKSNGIKCSLRIQCAQRSFIMGKISEKQTREYEAEFVPSSEKSYKKKVLEFLEIE